MARRRFRGMTSLKLGFLPDMNRSVQVGDAAVGVVVGLAAGSGIKAGLNKFAPSVLAQAGALGKLMPLATGVAAGAALYYAQKKSSRGYGHAVGSALAGLALTAREFLREYLPAGWSLDGYGEVTRVNMGGYGGFLVPDNTDGRMAGFGGFLVPDTTDQRLNELAAVSMGADDDGIAALVG